MKKPVCAWCGNALNPWGNPLLLYCSEQCSSAAQRNRRREKLRAQGIKGGKNHHICEKCGNDFINSRQKSMYCSPECYRERNHRITDTGEVEKRCARCDEWKLLDFQYYMHNSRAADGYAGYCKECCSAYQKNGVVKENRKKLRSQPHIKEKAKLYAKQRKQLPEVKERDNIREMFRARTDPAFALKRRVRVLMYHSLRSVKAGRKWQDLVGYSVEDLRRHIEKQFKGGMNWDRFLAGDIHIDHRVPVVVHNITSPNDPDFKKCWALKNLQPLRWQDNLSKHDHLDKPFQPSLAIGA